jgi:hypothetical protein
MFRIFSACNILFGVSCSVCSPSMYWPGFSSCTRKAPAMAAIGQPWFLLGVLAWSLLAIAQAFLWSSPIMAEAITMRIAVNRAGM